MIQVQIATTRHGWPLKWQDLEGPMSEEDADKLLAYHKHLDSVPPLGDHYRYRKIAANPAPATGGGTQTPETT